MSFESRRECRRPCLLSNDPHTVQTLGGSALQAHGVIGVRLLILGEAQYAGEPDFKEPRRPGPEEEDATQRTVIDPRDQRSRQSSPVLDK